MVGRRLKEMWKAGRPTLGGWLAIPDAFAAELMARVGFDWLTLDLQHGLMDYQRAVAMLQAMNGMGGNGVDGRGGTDTVPLVRVPQNEPGIIGKALDAGAQGIIIPLVNSRREAEQAVAACRYPPEGRRSFGPVRAALLSRDGYLENANQDICCIPMIETRDALENLDDILSVPGIDAIYVGPSDLSLALGLPPAPHHDEAVFVEAIDRILDGCRRHGVVPGIAGNARSAVRRWGQGFLMLEVCRDAAAMMRGAHKDLASVRDEVMKKAPRE